MQKEKTQTVLERKRQMGHLITCCPAFILLEMFIRSCSLAPKGTIRRYRVLKWLETKGKKHINQSYYISMNVDEHLPGFFVKNYLESFCDAANLSASLFLFHCSEYDFR